MTVSAQYAAEHLLELCNAVDRGEEVAIAREDQPTLKLTVTQPATMTGERVLGALRGRLRVPSDAEWQEMDKELERLMNDAPLMTSGEI